MVRYKVICFFTDLQDSNYAYHVGDTFPRDGLEASESRLHELSSKANLQGKPLIKMVEEEAKAEKSAGAAATGRKRGGARKG